MEQELLRTPLEEEHRALGAKLAAFAGWLMPIEYEGVIKEHTAVREAVGVFDLTHLGKIEVVGAGALEVLQRVLTNDLTSVGVGEAQYNLVLHEGGGIVDDLIVYRRDEGDYLVVPNASNTQRVLAILEQEAADGVEVRHLPDLVTLAVQGPGSVEVVGTLFPGAPDLRFMSFLPADHGGVSVLVARSGYTGEPGFELYAPPDAAVELWRAVLDLRARPVGLGARDTLRLEMGYPLHGNDIDEDHTPLEAALSWAVAFDKSGFTGRDALVRQKEQGVGRRLRGLRMTGRLIPRPHYAVLLGGEKVGETTSGSFSPTLRRGIAMAYLRPEVELEAVVEVDVRGRRGEAEVVRPPFVDRSPR